MSRYPFENVYRKPYELYSASVMMFVATITLFMPFPLVLSGSISAVLTIFAMVRALQGWKIRRYRKRLKYLPYYGLTAANTPMSAKAVFLGKGFRWDQRHTQRLYLARLPKNSHLTTDTALYKFFRTMEIKASGNHANAFNRAIAQFSSKNHILNPWRALPSLGGNPELHGVEPNEKDIYFDMGERVGHMLVLGTTRVGKTRLAEVLITQDIARGDTVIVFDPKGDADLMLRMYAESHRANRQFLMFHLGHPKDSCRYNPLENYARITEVATRIANQLPGEGASAAFKEFVWRFVNVLAKTMEYLGISPSYKKIYNAAANMDKLAQDYIECWLDKNHPKGTAWRDELASVEFDKKVIEKAVKNGRDVKSAELVEYVKNIKLQGVDVALVDALSTILSNDRSYFEKLVSSLYPLLEKLTTGEASKLINPEEDPSDERTIFTWPNVMANNAVVYIGLDALSDPEVAAAVGNAMFADLTSVAGSRYKYGSGYGESKTSQNRKVSIHADEFNELIGDEFIPLLNKAGGAGYQVTAYTQTLSDIEAKIGSAPKSEQIIGNLNTLIMLRVKTTTTAETLSSQLPKVHIKTITEVSGVSDNSDPMDFQDFASRNEDRINESEVEMLQTSDLVSLPKGQAFALLEGSKLFKVRLPMMEKDPNDKIPHHLAEIGEVMREKYEKLNGNFYKKTEYDSVTVEGETYGR